MTEQTARRAMPQDEAFALLEQYGIRVPRRRPARGADEALDAAAAIGYPVTLKIDSPDITHKSDAGGVRVGLQTPEDLREACARMLLDVSRHAPDARVDGFLVLETLPAGLECMAGMLRDAQLGAALMFGLGGVFAEALGDAAFEMLPVARADALRLLSAVRGSRLLGAYRGQPPRDMEAAASLLVSLGNLASEHPEIAEIDVNPFFLYEAGAAAADVRMLVE